MPNKQFQYQIERIPKITITTATTTTGQSTTNVTKRYNATVFNTTTKPIIKTNATAVTKKCISCYQIEIKKECSATANDDCQPPKYDKTKYPKRAITTSYNLEQVLEDCYKGKMNLMCPKPKNCSTEQTVKICPITKGFCKTSFSGTSL